MNGFWHEIASHLSNTIGQTITFTNSQSVSGGCINQAWKAEDTNQQFWFIKTNKPSLVDMFNAEANGLNEIESSKSIRSPKSYCFGATSEVSYLVLEHIELNSTINSPQAGEQLARMHHFNNPYNTLFGWTRNNTIGSTVQSNKFHQDWENFFINERLLFQLNLAKQNGYPRSAYENGLLLAEKTPYFFTRYKPQASLLHGDLWGGNCATDMSGNTVVFDPAVYYGDREADLAMTELFGGFSQEFYSSYNNHFPLDDDYQTRKTLYNLYHILNHYNLFKGSYASQAESMTQKLLSEVR